MFLAMKMKTFKHDVCGVNDTKCNETACMVNPQWHAEPGAYMSWKAADFNGDGIVDNADLEAFNACFEISDFSGANAHCESKDLDGSGMVEMQDFGRFAKAVGCDGTVCGELCLPKSEEAGLCGVNDASCAETVCRTDPATEKGETLKAELAN